MPDEDVQPLVYTAPEVAALLRISRSQVYRLAGLGELPAIRLGRCVRLGRAGVLELVQARQERKPGRWPALPK